MKEQLHLKKPISERMACQWMNHMGYHLKRTPKGQYKDGYKCTDVVAYWKNVFLPFVDTFIPQMHKWTPDGTLENGMDLTRSAPCWP